jgi:hypothetical protein
MQTPALARLLIAFLCGAFVAASPVLAETAKGNGAIRTQSRAVSGFTGIGLGLHARVEVKQGATEGLTIEADENLLPLIETKVEHGSLEIKPVRRNLSLESTAIKLIVQVKQLDAIAVGGSGTVVSDALRGTALKVDIGGSGLVDIKRLDASSVAVNIGGSGDARLAGAVKKLAIAIGGSGGVAAPALLADEVQVSIAGSGDAAVAARSSLDVTIAGTGNVKYSGDPSISQTIVGSGRVKRVGPISQSGG